MMLSATERRILDLLRITEQDITIEEISKRLSLSRGTASKYLEMLVIREMVRYRVVGRSKLFSVVKGKG